MIHTAAPVSIRQWIGITAELSKIRISQLVGLSTALGYILAAGTIDAGVILPTLGTFLLSCGSAALNQYQERGYDAMMDRTRNRPMPSGRITAAQGLAIALGLSAAGAVILHAFTNSGALLLGLFNIAWYNGLYTPLKRKSALAVIPGSLIGAIPPAIGWVAAGGALFDPQILSLTFFFFVWQIPHYWLLLMNLGPDYRKAGYPSLTTILSLPVLGRFTFLWIIVTALACLLIPMTGLNSSLLLYAALIGAALWLLWNSRTLLFRSVDRASAILAFKGINIYMLVVILALSLDRLFDIPL